MYLSVIKVEQIVLAVIRSHLSVCVIWYLIIVYGVFYDFSIIYFDHVESKILQFIGIYFIFIHEDGHLIQIWG